jgi:hypothetical protein
MPNKPIIERNGRLVRKDLVKLCVLWEKESRKDPDKVYYQGQMGEATVLMFEIESDNPNAPMFALYVGEPLHKNNPPDHFQNHELVDEDPED